MAVSQYRVFGKLNWGYSSGNALFALVNKVGSGKKINIQSVEVSSSARLGFAAVIDTNTMCPSRVYKSVGNYTITGGESLNSLCSKLDTASPDLSSYNIVIKKDGTTPINMFQWGNQTYTDATVAVGDVTFTPSVTPTPAWRANDHRQANRFFIVTSGNNIGVYRIDQNATTSLTLDPPLYQVGSTTGYIAEFPNCCAALNKMVAAAPRILVSNAFNNTQSFGSILSGPRYNNNVVTSNIVNPNEAFILYAPYANANNPGIYSCTFVVVHGANKYTYVLDFLSETILDNTILLSIENPLGSGVSILIESVNFTEIGSYDSPYLQLAPISGIEPTNYNDSSKKISSIKFDTNDVDLSSAICEIFSNVPVYPYGVPFTYFSEGSVGVPKGLNYLGTKDFQGPLYASLFPEFVAYK